MAISWLEGKGKDSPKGIDLAEIRAVKDPVFFAAAYTDRFAQPRDSLITAMLYEILHSPWFGVEHEHNPDTFQVSEYCVGGEPVQLPPPPPPPPHGD